MKHIRAAIALMTIFTLGGPACLAQTNEQTRKDFKAEAKQQHKADKAQAKADKAEEKAAKSDKVKDAARKQDKADAEAAKTSHP